ncbi:MAG TPA: sulfotransferase [Solirubrobacteraceae bacterium]
MVGDDRSGTTVIGTVLGQLPSATFVGEVSQVWRAFTTADWRCSCGEPLGTCHFWRNVRATSRVDADFDVDSLRAVTEQLRLRPRALARLVRPTLDPSFAIYAAALARIYEAIAQTAGATLIVDSSKSAPELLLTARTLELDLRVLHVVRDPRAVAHSRSRRIPAMQPGSQWMASTGPLASSLRWAVRNTLIEAALTRGSAARHRMRYEDFAADPARALRSVSVDRDLSAVLDELAETGGRLAIGPRHALDGNTRVLRRATSIEIGPDEEWRAAMSLSRRLAASVPALPLMFRYCYRTV